MESSRWSRWITIAAVLLLAIIAAVVSYSHMFELALRHGEPAWRAALRQFRANAAGVRPEYFERTQPRGDSASDAEESAVHSAPESEDAPGGEERPHLRVVQTRTASSKAEIVEPVDAEVSPPQIQRDAWAWALAHRREDGSSPTGQELAKRFGRKPRWGRLVKQKGAQGYLGQSPKVESSLASEPCAAAAPDSGTG